MRGQRAAGRSLDDHHPCLRLAGDPLPASAGRDAPPGPLSRTATRTGNALGPDDLHRPRWNGSLLLRDLPWSQAPSPPFGAVDRHPGVLATGPPVGEGGEWPWVAQNESALPRNSTPPAPGCTASPQHSCKVASYWPARWRQLSGTSHSPQQNYPNLRIPQSGFPRWQSLTDPRVNLARPLPEDDREAESSWWGAGLRGPRSAMARASRLVQRSPRSARTSARVRYRPSERSAVNRASALPRL